MFLQLYFWHSESISLQSKPWPLYYRSYCTMQAAFRNFKKVRWLDLVARVPLFALHTSTYCKEPASTTTKNFKIEVNVQIIREIWLMMLLGFDVFCLDHENPHGGSQYFHASVTNTYLSSTNRSAPWRSHRSLQKAQTSGVDMPCGAKTSHGVSKADFIVQAIILYKRKKCPFGVWKHGDKNFSSRFSWMRIVKLWRESIVSIGAPCHCWMHLNATPKQTEFHSTNWLNFQCTSDATEHTLTICPPFAWDEGHSSGRCQKCQTAHWKYLRNLHHQKTSCASHNVLLCSMLCIHSRRHFKHEIQEAFRELHTAGKIRLKDHINLRCCKANHHSQEAAIVELTRHGWWSMMIYGNECKSMISFCAIWFSVSNMDRLCRDKCTSMNLNRIK